MILSTSPDRDLPFTLKVLSDFTQNPYWSENFTIGVILRGQFTIRYQEQLLTCRPHDILFFPPFEFWTITECSKNARIFRIRVDSAYISSLCPEVINVHLRENQVREDATNPLFVSLCSDLADLVENDRRKELCTQMKLLSSINHLLITIFEEFGEFQENDPRNVYMADRIFGILTYISEHYTEKISGAEIAKHLGLHPAYFSSFFHRQFGIGFVEYLNTYRINRSLPTLLRTDRSIMEIALDHGFSNHKTYASAFRRVIGMSPTEYRRVHRNDGSHVSIVETSPESTRKGRNTFAFFEQFRENASLQ